ncbi:MAG: allantoinase AllB [Actinomycetota bacterium]
MCEKLAATCRNEPAANKRWEVTAVHSRRVVLPDGERPATVRMEGGRIMEVGEGPADLDFGDLVVLPGLVDSHVHVNEPGRTSWEGFASATAAAVAGGTTTVVDMPLNSIPPTVDVDGLARKREAAVSSGLRADVGFWGGIVPGSASSVPPLGAEGVCGFKVFMVDSGVKEFPPLDPDALAEVAPGLARLGLPLLVHAEEPSLLREPDGDPRLYRTYLDTRPAQAESSAIDRIADLCRREAVDAHVLHVASGEATDALRRASGLLTAETCPHYLTFEAGAIPEGATSFKCAPPIRDREDREALWEALASGLVTMVVSDHSPAPPDVKALDSGDFLAAWGGIASVELRLVATWDGARRRGFGPTDLARWLSSAPAARAGLGASKGSIAPGMDADLVVFDPDGATDVDAGRLLQRHPVTPYHGMRLAGRVVATYLRGEPVYGEGAVAGRQGRLLRRGE